MRKRERKHEGEKERGRERGDKVWVTELCFVLLRGIRV